MQDLIFGHQDRHDLVASRGLGVALSGGGYRATLFHLGVLWRLNELGILPKVQTFSSVSGGSLTAGVLAIGWKDLQFDANGYASNFNTVVTEPVRKVAKERIDIPAVVYGGLLPFYDSTDYLVHRLHGAYGNATLQDLPDEPRFIFNATNFQSGGLVRMEKRFIGDYRIGEIPTPRLALAKVVAASAGFPPLLSPVKVSVPKETGAPFRDRPEADPKLAQLLEEPKREYLKGAYRDKLLLGDGGIYDNLATETIWLSHRFLIVSDAGRPMDQDPSPYTNWLAQGLRVTTILQNQGESLRKRILIAMANGKLKGTTFERPVAYVGIAMSLDRHPLPPGAPMTTQEAGDLDKVGTRLWPFNEKVQQDLVNLGYFFADQQVRAYLKEQPNPDAEKAHPFKWPYPN